MMKIKAEGVKKKHLNALEPEKEEKWTGPILSKAVEIESDLVSIFKTKNGYKKDKKKSLVALLDFCKQNMVFLLICECFYFETHT